MVTNAGVGRKQHFGFFRRTHTFWVLDFLLLNSLKKKKKQRTPPPPPQKKKEPKQLFSTHAQMRLKPLKNFQMLGFILEKNPRCAIQIRSNIFKNFCVIFFFSFTRVTKQENRTKKKHCVFTSGPCKILKIFLHKLWQVYIL